MGLWNTSVTPSKSGRHRTYTDLLTFAFHGPTSYDVTQPLFIDAKDPSRWLSAQQFRILVRSLIAGLKAHNIQRGDCVLVHLGNNILYPALFFSVIGAGGVFMGSNPRSQSQELEHTLRLAEPKLIITSHDALSTVLEVSASRGMLPTQVVLLDESALDHIMNFLRAGHLPGYTETKAPYPSTGGEPSFLNFAHLLSYAEDDWVSFDSEMIAKSTPAAIFSTSGTGGLPKAAVLSHYTIISHHLSIHYTVPYLVTRLLSLPMFHQFGTLWAYIQPIRYGQPLYILPRFDLTQYLSAIFHHQITETYMVPAMIHTFNRCNLPITNYITSLRYVGVAGAPIDSGSIQQFGKLLHPDALAAQLWGMTEVGVVFQNRYGERGHAASIGRLLAGYDVQLVSHDGSIILDQNQPGELYVRGDGVLMGYKGGCRDVKNSQGWVRTGDVVYTSNGLYYIVGRSKELIKVRGWQVAPAELEAVLLQHPGIEDAAVAGVTSPDGSTELPRAFIVRAEAAGDQLTVEEVYMFSRRRLASYKALDGGITFVEKIPRTASGKIQRFKLGRIAGMAV